ncbi:MAG: hypothetical protein ACC628_21520, partial [Pirellulaceae bacterium]
MFIQTPPSGISLLPVGNATFVSVLFQECEHFGLFVGGADTRDGVGDRLLEAFRFGARVEHVAQVEGHEATLIVEPFEDFIVLASLTVPGSGCTGLCRFQPLEPLLSESIYQLEGAKDKLSRWRAEFGSVEGDC